MAGCPVPGHSPQGGYSTHIFFIVIIAYFRLKICIEGGERVIWVHFSSFGFVSMWDSVGGDGGEKIRGYFWVIQVLINL